MSDYIIGHIRTFTPILVGSFLSWLGRKLNIADLAEANADLIITVTGLMVAVYYALVRLLAEKWGWIGVFLGYNKAPAYVEAGKHEVTVTTDTAPTANSGDDVTGTVF